MHEPNETVAAREDGALAGSAGRWADELTDLENRTADAVMRLKVVKAALEGILPGLVRRPGYDLVSGCAEIIGESISMLEG